MGVTVCCAGLGYALAATGERTLIIDGDNKCGGGLIFSGLYNNVVYTLADYAKGACRAKQTLLPHPQTANLCYAPTLGLTDLTFAEKAAKELDGLFDYILLDNVAQKCCDGAVIVTEPALASVKSADCCRAYLSDCGITDIGLIVNKLCGGQILAGEAMTGEEIATLLHMPLRGVIPEDLTICAGQFKKETKYAFKIAAENIAGKSEQIYSVLRGYGGISGVFKRKLRSRI